MRWDIINYLVKENNYKTYLEIGVQDYYSNCDKINVDYKTAVDPNPRNKCDYIGTSDEYFASLDSNVLFDIIFIDGLHQSDQVLKDVENSLKHLSEKGTIVVHDCLPEAEYQQVREDNGREWTGDVWKAITVLKGTRSDIKVKVVDTDWGCGIIQKGTQPLGNYNNLEGLDWKVFELERKFLLDVISVQEFINDYKK